MTVGLALVFAAIGCVEFATGHLLITNAKVVEANDLLPYFRVNSLFFDPNIYGRYLALTMVLLAAVLLWTRRRREAILIALALGLLWAGLVFSLSQSSFAALLLGLAVLAALRWKAWPVLAGAGLAAAVALGLVLFAPPRSTSRPATSGPRPRHQRTLGPDRRRPAHGARPADPRVRLRRLRRALPRARARQLREGRRGVAHDPADRDGRAGRDRPRRLPGAGRVLARAALRRAAQRSRARWPGSAIVRAPRSRPRTAR